MTTPWRAVHETIGQSARRTPDAPGAVDGARETSFAELERLRRLVAGGLMARGVERGDRVALSMPRGTELVGALLGILDAGAAFVPVDPAHPESRNALILESAAPRLVLGDPPAAGARAGAVVGWDELVDSAEPADPLAAAPGDLAYVLYTSGSTGTPKGVLVPHRAIANYIAWAAQAYEVDRGTGAPFYTSVAFDLTLTALLGPLAAGRPIVVFPQAAPIDAVTALADALRARPGWSFVKATPAHLRLLNALLRGQDLRGAARVLVLGGEQLTGADVTPWRVADPDVRVVNEYGPTEATVGCCTYELPPGPVPDGPVPIGRAIVGAAISLRDASGRAAARGDLGELHIGGVCLADGYDGAAAETARRFKRVADGDRPGARMYATGDLCRELGAGQIIFVGRADSQVKLGGHRVELDDVAATVASHPDVREAVAALAPTPGGRTVLVAFVVLADAAAVDRDALRRWVAQRVPPFMAPAAIHQVSAMPLDDSGKVDREAVAQLEAPNSTPSEFVAPRTRAERFLAEAATELLGTPVGMEDDMLALGFDSILAIQLVHRSRLAGYWITPAQVLQRPNLGALARSAVVVGQGDRQRAGTRPAGQPPALTAVQSWFFDLDLAAPDESHQAVVLRTKTAVDGGLLAGALQSVIGAHEALRTAYVAAVPAVVDPPEEVHVEAIRVEEVGADRLGERVDAYVATARAELDVAAGDLVRAAVLEGAGEAWIVLMVHHLAVDGVSWTIVLDQLAAAYAALRADDEPRLARSSQLDAAARLDRLAASSAVIGDAPRWLGLPPPTVVPCDRSKEHLASETTEVTVALDTATTRQVLATTLRTPGASVGAAVLAAAVHAVGLWSGENVVVADVEGHGRDDVATQCDLAATVGWFTALYPVAVELADGADPLAAASAAIAQAPHKGASYGLLRYRSPDANIRRALAAQPARQLLVNYLGAARSEVAGELDWRRLDRRPLPGMGAAGVRPYALEVQARMVDGALTTSWIFSAAALAPETVEGLAAAGVDALGRIAVAGGVGAGLR